MGKTPIKWDFRDVSTGIQTIRQFLLGRKYVFHHRFPPLIAPRSIPPPEVPRGPEYKYSDQWYGNRDVLNSVSPPVVAPVAQGFKSGATAKGRACSPQKSDTGQSLKFPSELPTPGCVWWFDAHCYYKEVAQSPCSSPPRVPCAPPPTSPCASPPTSPCAPPPTSPCAPLTRATPCPCPPPQDERPRPVDDPCAVKTPCKLDPCKPEKVKPVEPPEVCDPCRDPKKKQ